MDELNNKNIDKLAYSFNQLNTELSKIAKFSKISINFDISSIDGIVNTVQSIDGALSGMVTKVTNGFTQLSNFNTNVNALAQSGSILASAYNLVNGALLGNVTALNLETISTTIATTATTAFTTALEFLEANPLMAVMGGIALVVGALTLFSENESEAEKQTRLFSKAQENKRNELEETAKTINKSTASSIEKSKEAEAQSQVLKGFVDNLKGLTDENGYVKNFEQAKYYVDQINSSMPGTVKLTEDGKLEWLKNSEAIEDNIKQLERKAKVEAYYDGYVESLKNETKLRGELTLAQNNYNNELEKNNEYQTKYNELMEKYNKDGFLNEEDCTLLQNYSEKLNESNTKLGEYGKTLDSAKGAYEANAKGAELYQQSVNALDGSIQASAELQANEYLELDKNGTSTWSSLAAASEDCKTRIETAQGDEKKVIEETSKIVQAEIVNKANAMGLSYDEMIKKLEESGTTMTDTEKKQLKTSYEQWKMSNKDIKALQASDLDTLKLMKSTAMSNMNENDKAKLAENLKLFAATGKDEGIQLCKELADNLEANNGQVNEKTKEIMGKIENIAGDCKPNVKVDVKSPPAKSIDKIKDTIARIPSFKDITCNIKAKGDEKIISLIKAPLKGFATGGFPDTGELFLAREAGPELVGRINGKTAVANNDQIVSGISSGVFNAVTSAMKGLNTQGSTNIHATFVMDGDVVGKQVIKYHNGVVRRTGHSPLMI